MAEATREDVLKALSAVNDPETGRDVVSSGAISGLVVKNGNVGFAVEVAASRGQKAEPLRKACEDAVGKLAGVYSVTAVLTAHQETAVRSAQRPAAKAPQQDARSTPSEIPGVKAVIAVASGKGGVGKSTVAVNLALALQRTGLKVGLLDADIYGPSVPRLLDLTERPKPGPDRKILPLEKYGLKAMSIGLLVGTDTPMIWRGPMVMSALTQMLFETSWAPLDILVLDMPPGTGDAQLTMAQQVPLKGVVIVSTPQDLALLDARRGVAMFKRVNVPVLGVVENMSYFLCPECGTRSDIFAHGGARHEAERLGVPFLGEVPLHMTIREKSDAGLPVVATEPDGPHAKIYRDIAAKVLAEIKGGASAGRAAPKIVIEA